MPNQPVLLEPEHRDLLATLVEVARRVRPQDRQSFYALAPTYEETRSEVVHPGLGGEKFLVLVQEIEVLADAGLVSLKEIRSGVWEFYVRPEGFEFSRRERIKVGQPMERVEETVRRLLSAEAFQRRHEAAYRKWTQAEALLWGSDSQGQLTTIGHLCRESMQAFAESLCVVYQVAPPDSNPANTVRRLRAVLDEAGVSLGESARACLDAVLGYWGTVSDLVQRQEHGAQREGERLALEDGRRVVFQTLIVMYEVHQALAGLKDSVRSNRGGT